jgi:hypothetical protein
VTHSPARWLYLSQKLNLSQYKLGSNDRLVRPISYIYRNVRLLTTTSLCTSNPTVLYMISRERLGDMSQMHRQLIRSQCLGNRLSEPGHSAGLWPKLHWQKLPLRCIWKRASSSSEGLMLEYEMFKATLEMRGSRILIAFHPQDQLWYARNTSASRTGPTAQSAVDIAAQLCGVLSIMLGMHNAEKRRYTTLIIRGRCS